MIPSERTAVPVADPAFRATTGAVILGLGTALPAEVVTNEKIAAITGVDPAWIIKRTGIRERRRSAPGDHLHDLAAVAAREALADAGVDAADLDLILVATCSSDEIIPHTAPLLANELGAVKAGALDVGAACSGWVSALALAAAMLESGRAERVLVVGAEMLARHIDYSDRKTAAIFGDGAGAVLVGARSGAATGVGPTLLGADGSLGPLLYAERGDGLIRMDGPEVFRHAVARMSEAALGACAQAGVDIHDLDLLVFHQANARILQSLIERLDLSPERVMATIDEHGNTSAASIPLALGTARDRGLLAPGHRVLLAAFGAGFTWAATVVTWGDTDAS